MDATVIIRPPHRDEVPKIAPLAAELVRMHHGFDPLRFMLQEPLEAGYAWFLSRELSDPKAVVLAAFQGDEAVGYAYGRLEPRDWNNLLDACAALHDVYVAPRFRRHKIADRLVRETLARLESLGAPRTILHVASKNPGAERFFASLGFRPTMTEMTREKPTDAG